MPIYEYYCPDNHTIYQFYAKTLRQGELIPRCPDNPGYRMEKLVSRFSVSVAGQVKEPEFPDSLSSDDAGGMDDPRMEAAMAEMEREFSHIDENDPKAMARMMRRMSELTGEKIDGEMEEVVRKLEEGVDPDALEEQMGDMGEGEADPYGEGMGGMPGVEQAAALKEARMRFKARRREPIRDPKLYDYED